MDEWRPPAGQAAPQLSVVLPTRDEVDNVEPLLARLRAALDGVDFELVIVDDSDDATPELLAQAQRQDPRVRSLHRPPAERQGGLSTAVVLGLRSARGRVVCVMDADLQHPPETIPLMLAAEAQGAQVVVASRYLKEGSRQGLGSAGRHLVSQLATALARSLFDSARASTDPLSGFFLCRSQVLRGIEFRPVGFKILLEILVCTPRLRVQDVPLRFQARASGRSKADAKQGWLFLRHLLSLLRDVPGSARPWKFAGVGLSGLALFLGLLELTGVVLGWPYLAAWLTAFLGSLLWTSAINLRVTFADLHRERYPLRRRYVSSALTAGGVQLVLFLGFTGLGLAIVLAGLLAALSGMLVNGLLNWQLVRRQAVAQEPLGLERLLLRLQRVAGADSVVALGPEGEELGRVGAATVPAMGEDELMERVGALGHPVIWTEPPSSRPQPRANVELESAIALPLEAAGSASATLLLRRRGRHGFTARDLEAVMRSLDRLAPPVPGNGPEALAVSLGRGAQW